MDTPSLRRVTADERSDFIRFWHGGFHEAVDEDYVTAWQAIEGPQRFWTATDDDGRHVASSGALTFDMSLPGGKRVGCAGVTVVTVRTDHRRRGLLRAMILQLHADARDREEPVAALYSSQAAIYGRFGYGVAVHGQTHVIETRHLEGLRDGDASNVRMITREQFLDLAPRVHEAVRATRGGMLSRSPEMWQMLASDVGESSKRPPQWFAAVGDRAVMRYRTQDGPWTSRTADGSMEVGDLLAVDPTAEADLWAHLAAVDLVVEVTAWRRPDDDPLRWRIRDEARLRDRSYMPLSVRLLDVPTALSARSYDVMDRVVFEVIDVGEPANHRRWSLDAGPDGSEVVPTADPADVTLDVADLASLWLGGVRPATLLAAGRLQVREPAVVARVRRLFATDRAPWCPLEF